MEQSIGILCKLRGGSKKALVKVSPTCNWLNHLLEIEDAQSYVVNSMNEPSVFSCIRIQTSSGSNGTTQKKNLWGGCSILQNLFLYIFNPRCEIRIPCRGLRAKGKRVKCCIFHKFEAFKGSLIRASEWSSWTASNSWNTLTEAFSRIGIYATPIGLRLKCLTADSKGMSLAMLIWDFAVVLSRHWCRDPYSLSLSWDPDHRSRRSLAGPPK